MPSYMKTDEHLPALIADTAEQYRGDLVNAGVHVDALWAYGGLKHHGYPAAAVVKINGVKERLRGIADATIIFCVEHWQKISQAERIALVDHELTHLVLVVDEDGRPIADDAGRPRLKMRPHDFELGVFDVIVQRHGAAAGDTKALIAAAERKTQAALPLVG